MAVVEVHLPSLLDHVVPGRRRFDLDAADLEQAFLQLRGRHPDVALHLFDEDGELRPHVLCFLNQTNTRWLRDPGVALRNGDQLLFMQAVSGG